MKFRFSWKITAVGTVLVVGMLRMSWWQWERHQWKVGLIANLRSRLEIPVTPLTELSRPADQNWEDVTYRRVSVSGTYDFSHEMLLRNRKYGTAMGVHVITPLTIEGTNLNVLVDRGFLPQSLADETTRKKFQTPATASFIGLVKESMPRKFLAPADPLAGDGKPWVERWLRVDIPNMQRQLPYPVLPVFLEIVETEDTKAVEQGIIDQKSSGRDEMFFLGGETNLGSLGSEQAADIRYPIPVFDTVIPPGRHLGYVFEWAVMALLTALICMVLQLRRPTGSHISRVQHAAP